MHACPKCHGSNLRIAASCCCALSADGTVSLIDGCEPYVHDDDFVVCQDCEHETTYADTLQAQLS
jgi:hypothetical protein